jgi:hypothetical protein
MYKKEKVLIARISDRTAPWTVVESISSFTLMAPNLNNKSNVDFPSEGESIFLFFACLL